MDSILTSIKKLLGIDASYTQFDTDIMIQINSVFFKLNQIGVGPEIPVTISSELETWTSKFGDISMIEAIKTYTFLNVKLLFDSSTMSSSLVSAYNEQIKEYEWRLNVQVDPKKGADST